MSDTLDLYALADLIERLRDVATRHASLLQGSEALTRYSLIDPVLRALGWDTSDPDVVRVEESAGGGRADYALLDADGSYALLIEAKRAGPRLPQVATTEVIKYAGLLLHEGKRVPRLALTNGMLWEFFDYPALTPGGKVNLSQGRADERALDLVRLLWRRLLVAPGHVTNPVAGEKPPTKATLSPSNAAGPQVVPLPDLLRDGTSSGGHDKRKPVALHLPDGSSVAVRTWREVLENTVRYLKDRGRPPQLPIAQRGNAKRAIVHHTPVHPSGARFNIPVDLGGLFVETGVGAQAIAHAVTVIEAWGQNPEAFRVQVA